MATSCTNSKKLESQKILWTFHDKSKIDAVFHVTNLGLVYKTKLGKIILSPRWSNIKSVTYVNSNHIMIVWDSHDGSRWKYQITITKNARSAMDQITKANLGWSKVTNHNIKF